MRRFLVGAACAAAASVAPMGAPAAGAQDTISTRRAEASAGDTLTLSLPEVQRLVLRGNPDLLAERQETAVARAELRQARLPAFNPQAELELPAAATGGVGQFEASLSQEIEVAGQRSLRGRAAQLGVSRAESTVRNAARETVAEASATYFEAFSTRQQLRLAEATLALNERLLSAVRIQAREGEISALEADLAEIDYGRSRARVLSSRREATRAEQELKRLVGIAPGQPLRLAEDFPGAPVPGALHADSLIAVALARRPDLAARSAAAEQFRALAGLARREALPNLRVGVVAERDEDGGSPRFGVGVGVPIPVLNRNQGRVAEQQARAEQATLEARAVEARIRTQVTEAVRAYASATEEVEVYESTVLEPARQSRERLETAYRSGKIGLTTLLLVRNQLLDAETGYWDAWLARRRALVDLQSATAGLATDTPDIPSAQADRS